MTITDIRIRKLVNEGRLRAVISITIDNALAIHDIKVIEGPNRLFVAMPSRREEKRNIPGCRPPDFRGRTQISRRNDSGSLSERTGFTGIGCRRSCICRSSRRRIIPAKILFTEYGPSMIKSLCRRKSLRQRDFLYEVFETITNGHPRPGEVS